VTAGAELTSIAKVKGWPKDFHYWASALLVLVLVPLLKRLHLPTDFDWAWLVFTYWVVLTTKAIFAATLLYLIGFSPVETIAPGLERFRREKVRILLVLTYFVILSWALAWLNALVLTVFTIAIVEVHERQKPNGLLRSVSVILLPAIYLFVGLLLVSAYNDIILSVRFFAADDTVFNSMDKSLLHGLSVPQISNWALQVFPLSFFHFLELIYFGMFATAGATLILVCQLRGRRRGLQFVGAILTAYYLALGLFYLWPSQGPYYLSPIHLRQLPPTLITYALQKGSVDGAQALWNHEPLRHISFDYYIAFPCMHIVQPLIAMWFLRFSRRMTVVLVAYNALLAVAIVLLEWHYVVDVLAGAVIAALAIAAVDGREFGRRGERSLAGISEVPRGVLSQ
jgi:hypothetical protein